MSRLFFPDSESWDVIYPPSFIDVSCALLIPLEAEEISPQAFVGKPLSYLLFFVFKLISFFYFLTTVLENTHNIFKVDIKIFLFLRYSLLLFLVFMCATKLASSLRGIGPNFSTPGLGSSNPDPVRVFSIICIIFF